MPSEQALPLLLQHPPGQDEATRLSYGKVDLLCSAEQYRTLAASAGLTPLGSEDISNGTLPTYAYLRAEQRRLSDRTTARMHDKATTRLEMACRMELLRYTILSFSRQSAEAIQAA